LKPLLTVQEVSELFKVHSMTVYRWIKNGKLSAVKIGREYRVAQEVVEKHFHAGPEYKETVNINKPFTLSAVLKKSEHIMALVTDSESLLQLELDFMDTGLAKGARLFKSCWWQDPDDFRSLASAQWTDLEALEAKGQLVIKDLRRLYQERGIAAAALSWTKELSNAFDLGFSQLWGSGSPNASCFTNGLPELLAFESYLNSILAGQPIVAICPYLGTLSRAEELELSRHHTGILVFSDQKNKALFRCQSRIG